MIPGVVVPVWVGVLLVLIGLALGGFGTWASTREGAIAAAGWLGPLGIVLAAAGAVLLAVPDFLVPRSDDPAAPDKPRPAATAGPSPAAAPAVQDPSAPSVAPAATGPGEAPAGGPGP